jgi:hypothetical protein
MGAADGTGFREGRRPFKGVKKGGKRKISSACHAAKGFAESPDTFGKPPHGGYAMSCQIN